MSIEGYIYVRTHNSYDKYNAYKLGCAQNIIDRDSTYATCEIERGKFILVIKLQSYNFIEKLMHNYFSIIGLRIYYDGGTEFYNKSIISQIPHYLNKLNIDYHILSKEEINKLTRTKKLNFNPQKIIDYIKSNVVPKEHQIQVLNNIDNFYKTNSIGKLLWSCGLGKTLLSILIVQKLNYKKVLIGVPSIYLQKQFINEIIKIYPDEDNILCIGGDTEHSTTNIKYIKKFIKSKIHNTVFVITTYSSCYLLNNDDLIFDFKIGDESHHLTGIENEETKNYKLFHRINSTNTLFMTATEKTIETKSNKIIYSMDDETIFGPIIDEKTVKWAIDNKKITDYNLLIISNTETEINDIIKDIKLEITNKELFMSAFMALKSIEKYDNLTHILICCNTTENSDIIKSYIDAIINKNIININKDDFYNESLHSNKKINSQYEIDKFKKSKFGIITSVYIFGEGFDLPKLNGVVFAENMMSDIRIVQTALRPNRYVM